MLGCQPGSREPAEHLVERTRDPDDVTTMRLDHRLIAAFVSIVDDANRLSHRVTDTIKPGDPDEPAGYALALNGHLAS
jgi:hypothetical protein